MSILLVNLAMSEEAYWYHHRDELEKGQVFVTFDGYYVRLEGRVPGDATKWVVSDWHNGGWSYEDSTIEPGDLRGPAIEGEPPTDVPPTED